MDNLAAYTAVPYVGQVVHQTDPDNLAVLGALLGLDPVPPSQARILEIGCADGGNLIPMAGRLPGATFVGLDLTPALIDVARQAAERAGTANITWVAADIADEALDLGPFDYIIAHGVWSWVPKTVRTAILARCGAWLSPRGLATISYNVWPGWSLRSPMRGMLSYHADKAVEPSERIQRARELAAWLSGLPRNRRLLGSAMRSELEDVSEMADWYLFHEHLAQDNHPVWFHEFAALAAENGLGYVGDAELSDMVPVDLPADVQDGIEARATDRVSYEQYLDFARERAFRRSVLAPEGAVVDYGIDSERVSALHVGARLFFPSDWAEDDTPQAVSSWPMGAQPSDPSEAAGVMAQTRDDKRMWRRIAEAWPATLPVEQAVAGLVSARRLRQQVLFAHLQGAARLFAEPRVSGVATDTPCVRATVRAEAHLGRGWVTTHWHRIVSASDMDRALLRILDGSHSVDAVAADLLRSFARGALPVPTDLPDVDAEGVARWLDVRLNAFANALLLESP